MKGKLIVIDGIDKVGKATQAALLLKRLKQEKARARSISFPQYQENVLGRFLAECLAGAHGDFLSLDPRIASIVYAADRFESLPKIKRWLEGGDLVIANRYVSANQIHQGGKVKRAEDRKQFLQWLDTLEYDVFGLPRPDLIIHLELPVNIARALAREAYGGGKKQFDVAEADLTYYKNSAKSAIQLARSSRVWKTVRCHHNNQLLSRDEIHKEIWKLVKPLTKKR
jgi:dTMP kinase